jgi:ferritin
MFKAYSDREMSNAIKMINYMNLRDGDNKLTGIKVIK